MVFIRRIVATLKGGARIPALLIVLMGMLSGCSVPGSVRRSVRIGLVAPFRGRYRYVGYEVVYAARMAIREASEDGLLTDHVFELVAYDDSADTDMASLQAEKLVLDPSVVAAVGHFRRDTTESALAPYVAANLALVTVSVHDSALQGAGQGVFRMGPGDAELAEAVAVHVKDTLRERELGIVSRDDGFSADVAASARRAAVVVSVRVSPDEERWLDKLLAARVGTVACFADPVASGEVALALRSAGWDGQLVGAEAFAASDFSAIAGNAATGAHFVTPWPAPPDVEGAEDFTERYRETSAGMEPGPLSIAAYEATWTAIEAVVDVIEAERRPTREAVAAAIKAGRRSGYLGDIAFGDTGVRATVVPLYWYRIDRSGQVVRIR
jgi:branched-chain amino acid transport system substrate-binding protein